jgi:hypothetical protein
MVTLPEAGGTNLNHTVLLSAFVQGKFSLAWVVLQILL